MFILAICLTLNLSSITLPFFPKTFKQKWGPSRECVQAGPALYQVIYMNTRA